MCSSTRSTPPWRRRSCNCAGSPLTISVPSRCISMTLHLHDWHGLKRSSIRLRSMTCARCIGAHRAEARCEVASRWRSGSSGRKLCGSSGPWQGGRCRCGLRPTIRLRASRCREWAAEHPLRQCRLVHGHQRHAREWLGTAHAACLQVREDGGLVAADHEHAGVEGLDLGVHGGGGLGLDLCRCGMAGCAVLGSCGCCFCSAGIHFGIQRGRGWGRSWGAGCLGDSLRLARIAVDPSLRQGVGALLGAAAVAVSRCRQGRRGGGRWSGRS